MGKQPFDGSMGYTTVIFCFMEKDEYWPIPFSVWLSNYGDGVRSILKQVVVFGLFALDNIFSLLPNFDHGVAESEKSMSEDR